MVRNWKSEFLENASTIFENPKKAEKAARRKEEALKKEKETMLKTIGQLTIERDFLQDCFRRSGRPVPELDPEKRWLVSPAAVRAAADQPVLRVL